ncbi:MAG TPA: helix-turn-helix domain-containing protein [Aquabacterium sp.]|nr:helix-turn-helix domain-containing protein [Aquabacterium sp.]
MSDLESVSSAPNGGAGGLLQKAREERGMSIDYLAATIKVPVSKLQALERNDWVSMPDANFNRALAMTVCRALKIEAAPVLSLMPAAVAVPLGSDKPPLNQPFKDFSHTGLTFERSPALKLRMPKIPPSLIAPVILLVAAGGIYLMPEHMDWDALLPHRDRPTTSVVLPSSSPPSSVAPVVAAPSASASSAVVSPVVEPAVNELVASASAASTPASSSAVTASAATVSPVKASAPVVVPASMSQSPASIPSGKQVLSASGSAVKLRMAAKGPSWVEILDGNGQKLISRQLAAGETTEIQGVPPLKVHVGNVPALAVEFNGHPVDLAAVARQNVARIELK